MQYTFQQFQDSRGLIDAFSEQHRDSSVNYGITFSMYRDALNTARTYSNQRCEREQTNCPHFIDWSKSAGKTDIFYDDQYRNYGEYD